MILPIGYYTLNGQLSDISLIQSCIRAENEYMCYGNCLCIIPIIRSDSDMHFICYYTTVFVQLEVQMHANRRWPQRWTRLY